MNILGVSCYSHDSAACLVSGGEVKAAAQEERFTRRKNSPDFPDLAANYCLQAGGITAADLDAVVFYEKPFLRFSRVLYGHACAWPFSLPAFLRTMPLWLSEALVFPFSAASRLGASPRSLFVHHHRSHAASAFLPSSFEEAAILVADGVGEWGTASCGRGSGTRISLEREMVYPDSLGLFYTALTVFLGFEANEGEGKVMGLAGCGRPSFREKFSRLAAMAPDGSVRLDLSYFSLRGGRGMHSRRLEELLGPARKPGAPLEERHADLAATLQEFLEEALVRMAADLRSRTGLEDLCLAGGVFLNCVANHKILERGGFKRVFIQPAAGDAGGALGAALYAQTALFGGSRPAPMTHAFLGPDYGPERVARAVAAAGFRSRTLSAEELCSRAAALLACGSVVGWFQGRMEFGPRALGHRSILGDPRNPDMKRLLNEKVKRREPFRPYAPAVTAERAADYFDLRSPSPYMLLAAKVRGDKRSVIPAVTHDDGTARVQTVEKTADPLFHSLLTAFGELTGIPVLINTSFNRRGEPVVCEPAQALEVFASTDMDALAIGAHLLEKSHG